MASVHREPQAQPPLTDHTPPAQPIRTNHPSDAEPAPAVRDPHAEPAIAELASSADPYTVYRALQRRGPHRRPEGWVIARWRDVTEALDHPALMVALGADVVGQGGRGRSADRPGEGSRTDDSEGGRPAERWRSRMARFSDGAAHGRRRAATERALADLDPADVEQAARSLAGVALDRERRGRATDPPPTGATGTSHVDRRPATERALADLDPIAAERAARSRAHVGLDRARRDAEDVCDGMALARFVSVAALADSLGLDATMAPEAAALARDLANALSPRLGRHDPAPAQADRGDDAAEALAELLSPVARSSDDDAVAAVMALLLQTCDATAGLVGSAFVAWARHDPPASATDPAVLVDHVLGHDPPVHWTRRTAAAPVHIAGQRIETGEPVWLLLAAGRGAPDPADRASRTPTTFGSGPHRCPGSHLAPALARGLLAAVAERNLKPVLPEPFTHEARPNLRIPTSVPFRPA